MAPSENSGRLSVAAFAVFAATMVISQFVQYKKVASLEIRLSQLVDQLGRRTGVPEAAPLPTEPLSLAGAQLKGSTKAKVAVVEYSDFQCPFCGRFALGTFPQVESEYINTGKVLFAFRNLPLESHQFARRAAQVARCAGLQGKFWQMHDLLFSQQLMLSEAKWAGYAADIGLDKKLFALCANSTSDAQISADIAEASSMGVRGTPSFLFGALQPDNTIKVLRRSSGTLDYERFRQLLDDTVGLVAQSR